MAKGNFANHAAYLEASDQDLVSMGSGVFVQLQKRNHDGGPHSRSETFVIANAHTVYREPGNDNERPRPWLKICGWVPGTAYREDLCFRCELVDGVGYEPQPQSAAPPWGGPRNDWVLLRIYLDELECSPAVVGRWRSGPLNHSFGATLYGYPEGNSSFNNGIVMPTTGAVGTFLTNDNSTAKIQGGESRVGMSGGPYFDFSGRFAGIHQARNDSTMQRTVILSTHLRDQLHEAGYEVVEAPPESLQILRAVWRWGINHAKWTVLACLAALIFLAWMIALLFAPPVEEADTVAQFFARNSMAVANREYVERKARVRGKAIVVDANDFHYVVDWPIPAEALTEDQLAKIGNIEIEPANGMPTQALPRGTEIDFEGTAVKFRDNWGLLINDAKVSRATDF